MFSDITLHQLRVFLAVARTGSYSRAAEILFLSQPGVSMQIKALERSIGQALFVKDGHALHLAAAGQELLRASESIFARLDETRQVLDELANGRRGTVRVGASTSVGIAVAPRALGAFHQAYPQVQIALDVVERFALARQLLADEIDLAIMGMIEDTTGLEVAAFLPNALVFVAAPHHPLAARRGIRFAELAGETFLVRATHPGARVDSDPPFHLERLFAAPGVALHVGMELRSAEALKQAVAAGLGIGVMPLDALAVELAVGQLVVLDVRGFSIRRHWSLVRRNRGHHSATARTLWDFLLSYRDALARQASATSYGTETAG